MPTAAAVMLPQAAKATVDAAQQAGLVKHFDLLVPMRLLLC
jgi:hypothetical protein